MKEHRRFDYRKQSFVCIYFILHVIITGQPTHNVRRPVLFCSLASVVVVCNTPRRASSCDTLY